MKRHLFLIGLALAILLVAVCGWVVRPFLPKRRLT
jgi:hypothetical protein